MPARDLLPINERLRTSPYRIFCPLKFDINIKIFYENVFCKGEKYFFLNPFQILVDLCPSDIIILVYVDKEIGPLFFSLAKIPFRFGMEIPLLRLTTHDRALSFYDDSPLI